MPIHDQSYRRYGGGKTTPGRAWLTIARAGINVLVDDYWDVYLCLMQ